MEKLRLTVSLTPIIEYFLAFILFEFIVKTRGSVNWSYGVMQSSANSKVLWMSIGSSPASQTGPASTRATATPLLVLAGAPVALWACPWFWPPFNTFSHWEFQAWTASSAILNKRLLSGTPRSTESVTAEGILTKKQLVFRHLQSDHSMSGHNKVIISLTKKHQTGSALPCQDVQGWTRLWKLLPGPLLWPGTSRMIPPLLPARDDESWWGCHDCCWQIVSEFQVKKVKVKLISSKIWPYMRFGSLPR